MSSNGQVSKAEALKKMLNEGEASSNVAMPLRLSDALGFPMLLEILDGRLLPKGVKGGRAGFYVDKGAVQCCLSWPEAQAFSFVTIPSLTGCMETLEGALMASEVKWLKDKGPRPR